MTTSPTVRAPAYVTAVTKLSNIAGTLGMALIVMQGLNRLGAFGLDRPMPTRVVVLTVAGLIAAHFGLSLLAVWLTPGRIPKRWPAHLGDAFEVVAGATLAGALAGLVSSAVGEPPAPNLTIGLFGLTLLAALLAVVGATVLNDLYGPRQDEPDDVDAELAALAGQSRRQP